MFNLAGVAAEFLSQAHWCRVLQMGAANFHDVAKFQRLFQQCGV